MAFGTLENLSRSSFVRTPPHLAGQIYTNILSFASLAICEQTRALIAVLEPCGRRGGFVAAAARPGAPSLFALRRDRDQRGASVHGPLSPFGPGSDDPAHCL